MTQQILIPGHDIIDQKRKEEGSYVLDNTSTENEI